MAGRGNILIGISGGIAAYKSLSLIRLFVKAGFNVKVIATQNALQFVTPLSIETLSKNKLYSDVFASPEEYSTEHISISDFADVLIVAPATANVIGKFASAIADDALSTTYLAMNKPVFIAPAMNHKMLHHPQVQQNMASLKQLGVRFINPTIGDLACGVQGDGRMEEPELIFKAVVDFLETEKTLTGKKALITAGPTVEAIDPVRYISNHSSGKMGIAIAEELSKRGADVTLVCGPIHQPVCDTITRVDVVSANQMFEACTSIQKEMDIIVMAAAVADYTPADVANTKIKKKEHEMVIELQKTKDILKQLGDSKPENQVLIGFALETDNEMEHALDKLTRKNLDLIVLNSLKDTGAGFGGDTNKITLIKKDKTTTSFDLKSKREVAKDIVNCIETLIK
jgi:phosphopantothenoylcysteine decarboxylase / phosphopantothenate---cysteine ligase